MLSLFWNKLLPIQEKTSFKLWCSGEGKRNALIIFGINRNNADASLDEILHTDETPALDVTVNSAGATEHPLQPGEYTLFVNVLEKTSGNITLSAK